MKSLTSKLFAAAAALAVGAFAFTTVGTESADAHEHGHHAKATVGKAAPDFTLTDLSGTEHTLSDYTNEGKVVVLEWFSPSCPFVVKHYRDEDNRTMNKIAADYAEQNVVLLAVNSAAPNHPYANVSTNRKAAESWGMQHPILMDGDGKVGKSYAAAVTPHMYIIDAEGVLRYAGAIDNNNHFNDLGDVNYVRQALDDILAGQTVSTSETKAYGCSVKYAK